MTVTNYCIRLTLVEWLYQSCTLSTVNRDYNIELSRS